ncbi:carboxylate-amine ligase [Actinopolymorpha pittospori]|uniref:Putative glutamate--cysteine ligase 2 n=1 Tax=Actinopolymorpha pittospori TaxID=648752 RepID=A0A927MTN8_9ACTN|nr:glutamate--cysteine ligase [Actinopolymorpha pittospori]MBE1605984.1 carboxylate-amine ligase [Actinopolymorpha pittospori]
MATGEIGETFGIEEEFLLVDPASRLPAPRAQEVLTRAASSDRLPQGALLQLELLPTQLEAASGVCRSLTEAAHHIRTTRAVLCDAAAPDGLRLVSVGYPVLSRDERFAPSAPRFARIAELYGEVARTYQSCGCHVHVGMPDRETAVMVMNHLRPWLPTLLAISVNSPFDNGRDTAYHSWRTIRQAQFPGAGIPPCFRSVREYDTLVRRLVECGHLVDTNMTFWLARPSGRFATLEVRAADAAGTVDDAILQAGLTRALVRTIHVDILAGRPVPEFPDQLAAAAVWSAARYGLEGPGVDPAHGGLVPATDLLRRLLRYVRDALEEAGDLGLVHELVALLRRHGTGAARQRGTATAGPQAVVDMLVAQTAAGCAVGDGS